VFASATARSFVVRGGFHPFARFPVGARTGCAPRLPLPTDGQPRLHVEQAITWHPPFRSLNQPGFSWRTRGNREWGARCVVDTFIPGLCVFVSLWFIPALMTDGSGRVEMWRGGLGTAYLFPALSSAGASLADPCSVSTSRSSNRTGGFPASGSRTRTHAFAHGRLRAHRVSRTSPNFSYRYSSGYWVYPVPDTLCLRRSHCRNRS